MPAWYRASDLPTLASLFLVALGLSSRVSHECGYFVVYSFLRLEARAVHTLNAPLPSCWPPFKPPCEDEARPEQPAVRGGCGGHGYARLSAPHQALCSISLSTLL